MRRLHFLAMLEVVGLEKALESDMVPSGEGKTGIQTPGIDTYFGAIYVYRFPLGMLYATICYNMLLYTTTSMLQSCIEATHS